MSRASSKEVRALHDHDAADVSVGASRGAWWLSRVEARLDKLIGVEPITGMADGEIFGRELFGGECCNGLCDSVAD